jgi:hypothetical protein
VIPPTSRKLIKLGHSPSCPIKVLRNGAACFTCDHTLSWWADRSILEVAARSIRIGKFRPGPSDRERQGSSRAVLSVQGSRLPGTCANSL